MKIFCVGRNYKDHAAELDNPIPEDPLIFCKQQNALLEGNQDFILPDFSEEVHYEGEIVIRICRTGKNIPRKEASQFYDKMAFGIRSEERRVGKERRSRRTGAK